MKNFSRIMSAAIVLLASALACNYPAEQVPPPPEAQTAAALTVQAILTIPVTETSVPQSIIIEATTTATASPIGSHTPTITPTYSKPILVVNQQTNCRTGPGQDYEVTFTYLPNKKLEIVGRYDPGNFWLVKSPESPQGVCWLWGEYVTVSGSYWTVASVTPPPTATNPPPDAPSIQKYDFFCNSATDEMTVTIQWSDKADNEIGYRVYRDGEPIADLPANSNSYADTVSLTTKQNFEYQIEVYNATDSARSSVIKISC